MKRKASIDELQEGNESEPSAKRVRPGIATTLNMEYVDDREDLGQTPTKRRASQRMPLLSTDEQEPTSPQDEGALGENKSNDGDFLMESDPKPVNATPTKRPRGRPRKIPLERPNDELGDGNITKVKRPRGRPRKLPVDVGPNGITPKKGGALGEKALGDELANGDSATESDQGLVSFTPMKKTSGGPRKTSVEGGPNGIIPTNGSAKKLFSTPVKNTGNNGDETPRIVRNIDRSARRKSTRALIERTVLGNTSDNDEEEDEIANQIFDSGDDENIVELSEEVNIPVTPSKRGRPKGSKNRQRSLTPPGDLTSHERYFFQNRGGRAKTSNNNLSSLALLDHEEYFSRARNIKDPHEDKLNELQDLHAESFNEWRFQLSQGFNICIYGWGSKRTLLMNFAEYIYKLQKDRTMSKIVVINGYVNSLTIRDVLNTVATAITDRGYKLGSQPAEMLENLTALLEEDSAQDITLIIHSIDRIPLRRPATQTILSRLSSHPQVHLVSSADHPSFPLLWDSSLRSTYNFLFHNCTTFRPYTVEVDVVDEVHELLGRSGRRVGGKEGVSFVLKSLPENAKNLFRVLIGEQLAAMDESSGALFGGEDDDEDEENDYRFHNHRKSEPGVEYRVLYQKAVEEFICSNEMNFRTLLKEFHDHQMIESRKDALGAEMLSVPFRKEELETILEDIMS